MQPSNLLPKKGTEILERTDCEMESCSGPEGDTLPCFACFDPDREYDVEATE